MKTTTLIVAAGAGRRMGTAMPKAFLDLGGRPVFEHSLDTFQAHPDIDAIVLVVPEGMVETAARSCEARDKVLDVLPGGARRRDSVLIGLRRAAQDGRPREDLILVHDAARPFVDAGLVSLVRTAAARSGAAVPGVRPADTVRTISGGGGPARLAGGRIDRDGLVLVQTPQGFRLDLLLEAFDRPGTADEEVTDDAALVERLGRTVEVVAGSPMNFKITTPDDLRLARALVAGGGPP